MFPKVSIIIPVYNSEKYINSCLNSVVNQTYKNIEIIIINDGSTDNSLELINEYKKIDKRINIITQENKGPSEARNAGISNSTGTYIVFIDCDDTVDRLYIEKLVNKINDENLDLVCCGYRDLSEYGELYHTDFNFNMNLSMSEFSKLVCKGTGGVPWGKIYRKDIINKFNLNMNKDIFMCEDLIFVLKYVSHCKTFGCISEYLYNYNRFNQNSISSNISIDYLDNYEIVFNELRSILNHIGMKECEINEIIVSRVQGITISLLERQSLDRDDIGKLNAIKNIEIILDTNYIKDNIEQFYMEGYIYKKYINIIKSKNIKNILRYGNFIHILKNINKRVKRIG